MKTCCKLFAMVIKKHGRKCTLRNRTVTTDDDWDTTKTISDQDKYIWALLNLKPKEMLFFERPGKVVLKEPYAVVKASLTVDLDNDQLVVGSIIYDIRGVDEIYEGNDLIYKILTLKEVDA